MALILITYDLNTPGQDYETLHKAIKNLGAWAHLMDSTWVVSNYGLTAQSVYDTLREVVDKSTYIFCVDITGQPRQGWLKKTTWEWFHQVD